MRLITRVAPQTRIESRALLNVLSGVIIACVIGMERSRSEPILESADPDDSLKVYGLA